MHKQNAQLHFHANGNEDTGTDFGKIEGHSLYQAQINMNYEKNFDYTSYGHFQLILTI